MRGRIESHLLRISSMAEEDKTQEQNQKQEASKLDAIVKECFISPSQEEILQRIPHCNHQSPQQSHATTSQRSSRDFETVGAPETIFYTPDETQQYQESNAEEEDSFDPKFESDRDESLSLYTQCPDMPKSFPIFNSTPTTPPKTKSHSVLQLQEAASANSKFCNSTLPQDKSMVNPPSCRRRLVGLSKEVEESANPPPDLGAAEIGTETQNAQVNYSQLLDSQDINHLETQDFQNLGQIQTSDSKLAEVDEKVQGQCWVGKIRECRTLPPFLKAIQKEISAPTGLEMGSSAPTSLEPRGQNNVAMAKPYPKTLMSSSGKSQSSPCLVVRDSFSPTLLEKEVCVPSSLEPKRQYRLAMAKPYPETLMDVIMHCSGDPPVGYEDADVLEAAINAGITFPPPLSRHSFSK